MLIQYSTSYEVLEFSSSTVKLHTDFFLYITLIYKLFLDKLFTGAGLECPVAVVVVVVVVVIFFILVTFLNSIYSTASKE
jgi:hypothetical protein